MKYRIGKDGKNYRSKEGAGILFTDGKHILLLKRAEGDEIDRWGIPGGKVKPGELAIDAAIREAKEEAGRVRGQRVGKFEEKDNLFRWTTFVFKVTKPFSVTLNHEHKEYKWIEIDKMKDIDLHSKFKKNVPFYMEHIKKKLNTLPTFREWLELL